MEIVNKPDIQVFASEAKTGEILKFPDVLRGWGVTLDQTQGKPPLEWMNDAFNRIDLNNLYLLQQGIPEWDGAIRYPVNSIIKHEGKIYLCAEENDNNEPSSASDKWSLYIRNASEKDAGILKLATQAEVNTGVNDTNAVTPKKLAEKLKKLPDATLTQKGITQLTNTIDDSEDKAATPKAVNAVKKKADQLPNPILNRFPVGQSSTAYRLVDAEEMKTILGVPDVVQTTGASTTNVMSEKATTDAINAVKTTANKVARGWRKDPNTGLIEQWGTESISDARTTIKFPIAFTKSPFFIITNHFKNNGYGRSDTVNISSRNNIQFVAQIRTPTDTSVGGDFDWYAIGE